MAVEATDVLAALRFLEAAGVPSGLVLSPACEPSHGAIRCRVLVSGWRTLQGAMLLAPPASPEEDVRVCLAAANERALRDLLLSIPPARVAWVLYPAAWMRHTIAEILEGHPVSAGEAPAIQPPARDLHAFRGVKRGSRRPEETASSNPLAAVERVATGKKDPALLMFRDLASLRGRLDQSRFVAEGALLVDRALRDGLPVGQILYTPAQTALPEGADLLRRATEACVPCCRVNEGLMGSVTTTRPVPSIVASVFTQIRDASQCHLTPASVLLVADSVGNPNNLGMVLRTADAAGVEAVVLLGEGASPFHKECVRAARGAVGRLPLFSCADEAEFMTRLVACGFRVLGTSARAEHTLYDADLHPPLAFVVGNENEGVRAAILDRCTDRVRIPMAPGQSSLNVGVAAGVLLFEAVRRIR